MKSYAMILGLWLSTLVGNPLLAASEESSGPVVAIEVDPESGLIIAPGWETVKANCTACHSAKFIIAQQGDRNTWLQTIRWMQRSQGLWVLDAKTEDAILTYLAAQYPPIRVGRRANLPASAMPPNPWK
ncbi:MAG: hypothetical protein ACU85E_07905 [Gammaproteobacteria bacterium]